MDLKLNSEILIGSEWSSAGLCAAELLWSVCRRKAFHLDVCNNVLWAVHLQYIIDQTVVINRSVKFCYQHQPSDL